MRIFGMEGSEPIKHGWGRSDWPWTWIRIQGHVATIKSVYQRAALDKDPDTAVPPRWMFFDSKEISKWFDSRKESA